MSVEFFIAKRIVNEKTDQTVISRSIAKIAIVGISLGLVVMILSVAIVTGFKTQIRNKVIGFNSHINILNYDTNSSYETKPISKKQSFYPSIKEADGINHIQVYGIKAGIIKTKTESQGVVLKGIGGDFDWSFFNNNIIKGVKFQVNDSVTNNNIIISQSIANLLKLDTGQMVAMYFIQKPIPRWRKFKISGIYDTGLEEYDKIYVLADIKHIQKLNKWNKDQVSGFELFIDDFDNLDEMAGIVYDSIGYDYSETTANLEVKTARESNSQIFDWLDLTDTNVIVILVIMSIVAGFNMVSGLLILILDRTNMIGVLKSVGLNNIRIRKLFLYQAFFLIGKGLVWGNIVGIGMCLVQKYFGIISLDPSSYYMSTVPINLNLWYIIALNLVSLLLTLSMLIIPSMVIARISPIKAIRFN